MAKNNLLSTPYLIIYGLCTVLIVGGLALLSSTDRVDQTNGLVAQDTNMVAHDLEIPVDDKILSSLQQEEDILKKLRNEKPSTVGEQTSNFFEDLNLNEVTQQDSSKAEGEERIVVVPATPNDQKRKQRKPVVRQTKKVVVDPPETKNTNQYVQPTVSFNTTTDQSNSGASNHNGKEFYKAIVHGDQVLSDGKNLTIRLLEDLQIDGKLITKGSYITALANVASERVNLHANPISHQDGPIFTKIEICDGYDQQPGIYTGTSVTRENKNEILNDLVNEGAQRLTGSSGQTVSNSARRTAKYDTSPISHGHELWIRIK